MSSKAASQPQELPQLLALGLLVQTVQVCAPLVEQKHPHILALVLASLTGQKTVIVAIKYRGYVYGGVAVTALEEIEVPAAFAIAHG